MVVGAGSSVFCAKSTAGRKVNPRKKKLANLEIKQFLIFNKSGQAIPGFYG